MTPDINSTHTNPENKPPKNKGAVARWIIGGVFALIALSNGFHFSTLFLLCAAFLMLPFSFTEAFLNKRNIKTGVAIVLSIALLFVGAMVSPPSESTESTSDDTAQTTTKDDRNKDSLSKPNTPASNSNSTKPNNSSSSNNSPEKPDNSTSNNTNKEEEKVVMVWIVSTGNKYHSKSTCSQMTAPQQITIDEAKELGYTACQKCH